MKSSKKIAILFLLCSISSMIFTIQNSIQVDDSYVTMTIIQPDNYATETIYGESVIVEWEFVDTNPFEDTFVENFTVYNPVDEEVIFDDDPTLEALTTSYVYEIPDGQAINSHLNFTFILNYQYNIIDEGNYTFSEISYYKEIEMQWGGITAPTEELDVPTTWIIVIIILLAVSIPVIYLILRKKSPSVQQQPYYTEQTYQQKEPELKDYCSNLQNQQSDACQNYFKRFK